MRQENFFDIELFDLSVGYKQQRGVPVEVLNRLNFSAAHGEMVALIGSNGTGKSTLLRTIAGFQPWLAGDVRVGGKSIRSMGIKEMAQIISFVSTENIRVPNMTVFDLVAYGRFPYTNWMGSLTEDDRAVINSAIGMVGIKKLAHRSVLHISDGERQRAMIARALAQDTPVIILDEPTAYLDVSNKYEIFHLLQVMAADRNKTIILSTHDLNIAFREVDKLWMITENFSSQGAPEDAALKGWLDQLFQNEHIGFDTVEGGFFFKKKFRAKVKVIGDGVSMMWTLKALNRKGYQIVIEAEPDFTVHVKDNLWEYSSGLDNKKFENIYQLISFLDKQFGYNL
ncbi:MAG: ABC transporter ATP-binding protein [Bacteroidales bacterium]|nr:ABC transporter ATP-binding protein [Bacteroidales bacterium]